MGTFRCTDLRHRVRDCPKQVRFCPFAYGHPMRSCRKVVVAKTATKHRKKGTTPMTTTHSNTQQASHDIGFIGRAMDPARQHHSAYPILRGCLQAVFVAAVSYGCDQRPTDAAEELMAAGMFAQAAALLEEEVLDSPTNAEAHLLLGMTNLPMGNPGAAGGNIRSALRLDPSLRDRIVELLLSEAGSLATEGNFDESQDAVALAASIDPNAAAAGVDTLITALKTYGRDLGMASTRRLVQSILSLDHNAASNLRSFLVNAANRNISSRTEFIEMMDFLNSTYSDMPQDHIPVENYLYGAYRWLEGNRNSALDFFLRVPEDQRDKLGLQFVDTEVPVGRYSVQRSVSGDFGWGAWTLSVDAVELRADRSMLVNVRVTNHTNRRQHFVFFGVQGEEERIRLADASDVMRAFAGGEDERFYVLDDFGNKCSSQPPHFVGVPNRERFNSANDAVILEPGQTIEDEIVFPCRYGVRGVTGVTFVSPRHNGHQWEVRIDEIDIRIPAFRPMGSS